MKKNKYDMYNQHAKGSNYDMTTDYNKESDYDMYSDDHSDCGIDHIHVGPFVMEICHHEDGVHVCIYNESTGEQIAETEVSDHDIADHFDSIKESMADICSSYEEMEKSEKPLEKNEVEVTCYSDGLVEIRSGEKVSPKIINNLEKIAKKEGFNLKSKHKSKKGGLTESGRKAYNRATGSNLKRPQPEGGPRKKSFCARNRGQIRMHNIDCRKTPEKRACLARKRWKC